MRTLLVLLDKEFRQFFRNPFLPKMAVAFPMMVMLVIPWITTMDVRHVGVSVVDNDRSTASRRLVGKIGASDYFRLYGVTEHYGASLAALERGDVDVIVEIPDDFERSIAERSPRRVSITANGVNALKGSLGSQYMVQTVMGTLAELLAEEGVAPSPDLITVQNRYNPTLDYRAYMIPALMIMLLIMLCGFLPALNLVGEKERGTIEQINVTPVGRLTFTLAKLIPLLDHRSGRADGRHVAGMARVYGLTPVGAVGAVYLAAALFIVTMSGLGVAIANRSDTMQQTMFVMFFFVMIFVLMSGLITPIASMPGWAQAITRLLPPRYFIGIMRAVYLKGTALGELWGDYAALAGFALVFGMSAILTLQETDVGPYFRSDVCELRPQSAWKRVFRWKKTNLSDKMHVFEKIIRIFTKMLR